LLKNVKVKAEIDKKNAEINKRLDLAVDRLKEELARLCYYDPGAFLNADGSAKALDEVCRIVSGFAL